MTTDTCGPLLGEANGAHHPVLEPGKADFLDAVTGALADSSLGEMSSGYGYGGEAYESATELDHGDRLLVALRAYYAYIGAPRRCHRELFAEAQWLSTAPIRPDGSRPTRYPHGVRVALDVLRSDLETFGWREDTATVWARYADAATGQSLGTALLVQDRFGGQIVRVELDWQRPTLALYPRTERTEHYFNVLDGGFVVDLTRSQFSTYAPHGDPQPVTRQSLLSDAATTDRYRTLLERLS